MRVTNRIWQIVLGFSFCILIAAGLIGLFSIKKTSASNSEEPQIDISDPNAKALLCGPNSVCTALRRLGIPMVLKTFTDRIRLTQKGVTMNELVRVASYVKEIIAQEQILTWEELKVLDGTAVLFVNDSHFVATDPREKEDSLQEEHRIRIYDEGKPARWYSRDELKAIWNGNTIVLCKKQLKAGKKPQIEWEHCQIDAGSFNPEDTIEYQFNFRNVGKDVLRIKSINKSCNCAGYKLSSQNIPSGQRGWIEGTIKPIGRRGKFKSFLLITTNDPDYSDTILVMESLIKNEHILSKEVVYCGKISQGEEKSTEIFIHDPGDKSLYVVDAQVILDINDAQNHDYIQSSLELYKIEEGSKYVGMIGAYPLEAGDYVVRLKNVIHNNCFTGSFKGKIIIDTNLKSPHNHFEIPVYGEIIHHVHSLPANVMLVTESDENAEEVICLQSLINKRFEVHKFWIDNTEYITIKQLPEQESNPRYKVSVLPTIINSEKSMIQTIIHFQLDSGVIIDVPVIIWRK